VEEVVDLPGRGRTHDGLQLGGAGVAEQPDAGEALQQGGGFDPADPGDAAHQSQHRRLRRPGRRPPPEGVLSALAVDLQATGGPGERVCASLKVTF